MTGAVDDLIRLGLTMYEAKAYIATVGLGEGTVVEISAASGVPRSRAYDVMERLAEKGLVEIGSSSPRIYRANEPRVASDQLMEQIKQANDEMLLELNEVGRKAEKRDNPIWTVKGEWAIDHKVKEVLEGAKKEATILCFSKSSLLKYGRLISIESEKKRITIVLGMNAEEFAGLLGSSRVMGLKPMPELSALGQGSMTERGYFTGDGKYCIELVIYSDQDDALLVTKEGDGRRALVVTGTVLIFFSHTTMDQVVQMAEDVPKANANAGQKKARQNPK